MTLCGNCKGKMSCSCQGRTASDGKKVCTRCKGAYEAKLKKDKMIKLNNYIK